MTIPSIEQVIAAIPDWAGRVVTAERIPAGLTNTNWRVVVDGTPFFVRIPGADTELLAVDRGNEIHNTIAAAEAGVAPRVVQTVPEWDVFALEWLDARTMSNETLRADGMPSRIAAVLRQLHAGPRFRDDFDMFRVAERYMALVDERSIAIPAGYREHLALVPRIEAALGVHRPATVPCHNDLLAENYLDDGERLWLVDWEYSGNNDPAFELGNTAQELGFDDAQVEELCAAYFGDASPALLARMRLQMIMSDVGWTLWAAIQARISTIDYDFTGWAEERWARAETALDGPDFGSWLRGRSAVRSRGVGLSLAAGPGLAHAPADARPCRLRSRSRASWAGWAPSRRSPIRRPRSPSTRRDRSRPGEVARALADGRIIRTFAFRGATQYDDARERRCLPCLASRESDVGASQLADLLRPDASRLAGPSGGGPGCARPTDR